MHLPTKRQSFAVWYNIIQFYAVYKTPNEQNVSDRWKVKEMEKNTKEVEKKRGEKTRQNLNF